MTEQQSPRIFVSYARSDGRQFACALRSRLTEQGFSLWQDLTDMQGGQDWWSQITEAIRNVEYLVLMMTPNALRSNVVRQEWRLARQEGVCVIPVKAVPDLDFKGLPHWMQVVHFIDTEIPEQWTRFIRTLESPCQIPRVPFMAPDLPRGFVRRRVEFRALVTALLDEQREEPLAITAALQGAGGFGKTTLAIALCHDERVQETFHDGILWVTLGENPGDLTAKVNDLIRILSPQEPGFANVEAASVRFAEFLVERVMLLVIDDVWNEAHLKPFLRGGKRCSRLITTRNNATLPPDAHHVKVDAMAPSEAVSLLGSGLPVKREGGALRALAKRLGE
jgi:hypothetical protein